MGIKLINLCQPGVRSSSSHYQRSSITQARLCKQPCPFNEEEVQWPRGGLESGGGGPQTDRVEVSGKRSLQPATFEWGGPHEAGVQMPETPP